MRIAIVGAGISGLVAAHLLRTEHDVRVFEAADWAGGHAHSVRVALGGASYEVDTGFIVFNDRNYPSFERLLAKLEVASQPSEMSFSVSDGQDFEYSSTSPAGLFANPRHLLSPRFLRMLADGRRFQRQAGQLLAEGHGANDVEDLDAGPSLGDYLESRGYSRHFIERLIVPQAAAVWSADPSQMWTLPARFLVQFFAHHGMLDLRHRPRWRTVVGGSRSYVERLVTPLGGRILLSAPVTAVARAGDQLEVAVRGRAPERFDRVVLATHSDQALALLSDPSEREREILGAIAYRRSDVVLHTDRRLLPRRRRAWASWNYHLGAGGGAGAGAGVEAGAGARAGTGDEAGAGVGVGAGPAVTYHMNRLQRLNAPEELCVTLNLSDRIEPARVLGRWCYSHPVYTAGALAAQRRREEIDGVDGIHYCGAYWGWGFHEDGVVSAMRTCAALGGRL